MNPTIYDNMSLTDRASKRLLSFPQFRDSEPGQSKNIAFLWWVLLSRVPDKDGKWICTQGPHYTLATIDLDEVNKYPRIYAFNIAGRLLCVQFSKDYDFDPSARFRVDYIDDFVLYPTEIDEGVAAKAPSK